MDNPAFPAGAEMNLPYMAHIGEACRFPRRRGDEPLDLDVYYGKRKLSPQARG